MEGAEEGPSTNKTTFIPRRSALAYGSSLAAEKLASAAQRGLLAVGVGGWL